MLRPLGELRERTSLRGPQFPFCLLPRGDVVDGEEDQAPRLMLRLHRARVQEHRLGFDAGGVVLQPELAKPDVLLEHLRERFPQCWEAPPAVSHFVDEMGDRLLGRELERLVEQPAGPRDTQIGVEKHASGTGTLSTIVSARSRAAVTCSTLNLSALMSS